MSRTRTGKIEAGATTTHGARSFSSFREIADFLWQNAEQVILITAAVTGKLDVTKEAA